MSLFKYAPLPLLTFLGLAVGIACYFSHPVLSHWIWFYTLVVCGLPIAVHTLAGMFRGQFASDIVALLAILTALVLDQTFAGAIVVLMQSGGEAIEAFGLRRATSSLQALLARAPRIARRTRNGQMEEIDVHAVQIGDTLIVRPGDLIPVDGTVLSGSAEVDESALTGEALPRLKTHGSRLLSGSVAQSGPLEMRADKQSLDSQYEKIVQLVQKAQEEKAPIQRLADRYAVLFTPLTLLMALIGYLYTRDPTTVLSVLVVATPCPLILATPLAVICGINRAANAGIIVKGGAPIEQIASTQAALFDKTGTLTLGTPTVESIVSLNGEAEEQILYHAAILDQFSSHSVAHAIVQKARARFPLLPLPRDFQEYPGQGVEGRIDNHHYRLGSRTFLNLPAGTYPDKHLVFLCRENTCIGYLVLDDQIRPNAAAAIAELRALGVRQIALLTGDSAQNAKNIATQAGIDAFQADLLPEQKVSIVKDYATRYHPLIMVGDGINDAPALATATVGIAMGAHGTALSAEAADIVLLVDDLAKVPEAVRIGRHMLRIAKQSIWIGIGLSFCLMIVAATGHILPAVGALLQEVIDVAVILNALRAR